MNHDKLSNGWTQELERLRAIISDRAAWDAAILSETCPTDEYHCGCVPILRKQLQQTDDAYHKLKSILNLAHAALLDSGVSVPDFDQDISPAIRALTARIADLESDLKLNAGMLAKQCDMARQAENERDRLRTLAGELAGALHAMQVMSHHQEPRKLDEALTWRQNDMKTQEMCKTALYKARNEGVIE